MPVSDKDESLNDKAGDAMNNNVAWDDVKQGAGVAFDYLESIPTAPFRSKEISERINRIKQNSQYDVSDFAMSDEDFDTPEMGDYYLGAVDDQYLQMIDNKMNDRDYRDMDGSGRKAAFYTENPPFDDTCHKDGQYLLKAALNNTDYEGNWLNGSHLRMQLCDLHGNGEDEQPALDLRNSLKDKYTPYGPLDNLNHVQVSLYGLDCPTPNCWATETEVPRSYVHYETFPASTFTSDSSKYVYDPDVTSDSQKFVQIGDVWYQMEIMDESVTTISFKWLAKQAQGDTKSAEAASARMNRLLKNTEEVRVQIDETADTSNAQGNLTNISYSDEGVETLKKWAGKNDNSSVNNGLNLAKEDYAGHLYGTAYIKIDGKWINLSKAMIAAQDDIDGLAPDNEFNGPSNYYPQNYDPDQQTFADAYFDTMDDLDNRRKIQKQIFKKEWTELKHWTVTIGDVTLLIPPTNISIISESEEETMPLLRASGSMHKTGKRNTRTIAMQIYFNGDKGINGFKYKTTAPGGQEFTYSMDGLRSLIAEFKFTPFLPIENEYINNTAGIQAVVFDNLTISNVPSIGPQLMKAELTMTEFDFGVYMPEVAQMAMENDREDSNWFASAFNWDTMRYYYQRCIMRGDELATVGYSVNSKEYQKAVLKNRTALQPMNFKDSTVKFYIADIDYLQKMLNAKLMREQMNSLSITYNDNEKNTIKAIGSAYADIENLLNGEDFKQKLAEVNSHGRISVLGTEYADNQPLFMTQFGHHGITAKTTRGSGKVVKHHSTALGQPLNDAFGPVADKIRQMPGVESVQYFGRKRNGSDADAQFTVGLAIKFKDAEKDADKLRQDACNFLDCTENDFFQSQRVLIPYSVATTSNALGVLTEKDGESGAPSGFHLNTSDPDYKFLQYCKTYVDDMPKTKENGQAEGDDSEWKKSPNLAQLDNMRYVPLDMGDFVVSSFTAALTNHISRINMEDVSGASPQYLGGEDTIFNMTILTQNEKCVSAFENVTGLIAYIMRTYRKVIPCCPLKIDSEFSRFLGVNEVTITNANVSTVDGQPGLFSIDVQMRSTDRTLRNREATEMLEADNAGQRYEDFFGGGDNYNKYGNKSVQSYFKIENSIAKAELYPDLELPTLAEMEELGYDFVRYKFQDSRVYVDPDFYFVYLSTLTSQYTREIILQAAGCGVDGTGTYTDSTGASATLAASKYNGYTVTNQNDTAKQQIKQMEQARNAQYNLNSKQTPENLKDRTKKQNVEDYEAWNICGDIKPMYLEPRYKKEYDSYIAQDKADKVNDATSDSGDDTRTEGKWVYNQLATARQAAELIDMYLKNMPITEEIPQESAIRNMYTTAKQKGTDTKPAYDAMKTAIENGVSQFLSDAFVTQIFEMLNIDITTKFTSITKDIVYSAACAATGEKEYSNKKESTNWRPAPDFIGVSSGSGLQDATSPTTYTDVDRAVQSAVEFGCFKIKMFTRAEFQKTTGEGIDDTRGDTTGAVNMNRYLIDPYYRMASEETIMAYKLGCINSPKYCTIAYMRLMLYWLKNLIDNQAYPSIDGDVLRKVPRIENDVQKTEKEQGVQDQEQDEQQTRARQQFFTRNSEPMDAGKMWTCAALASTDGNMLLRKRIHNRDYRALNEYIHGCSVPQSSVDANDKTSSAMRKMDLALVGLGRINDTSAQGVPQDLPAVNHARDITDKKYIDAAEDPEKYCMHSCHDMIVNDARGRMLRAFPTYYMMFIDEGRDIGTYHLHDNFYNNMAIVSFQVVKDRKNPADTAIITLSNIYQSFTTEGEDKLRYAESTNMEAFKSIFAPVMSGYAEEQEAKRTKKSAEDKLRLRAGARIHLRAGYGANASMLTTLFNGVITEVTAEDMVSIEAQGDGVELMNPILEEKEAHSISSTSGWLSNGETPKQIMTDLLTTDGGIMNSILKKLGRADLIGDNPYGIFHFGDKNYTEITKSGEPTQNIFEAWARPCWGDDEVEDSFGIDQAPSITFDVFGKTVWDVANICKSVMPDFICAVAPFDFRSTLFIGMPRYYYAYGYKNVNGAIMERRKPYQQFHMYTSGTDIIGNGIAASSKRMKTTAMGLYQVCASFNTKEQHKVGPLYVDYDIYPEEQKSMVVDTQLLGKGAPFIGAMGLNAVTSFETVDELVSNEEPGFFTGGHNMSNKAIAWRMTASALKDSVKDMYCGDMVVLGDPSVKPHDRLYILDNYEGISGQCTAKEVVHSMSIDQGFITTISPDCICSVDDNFEQVTHHWFNTMGIAAGYAIAATALYAAAKWGRAVGVKDVLKSIRPDWAINKMKKNVSESAIGKYAKKKGYDAAAKKVASKTGSAVKDLAKKGAEKAAETTAGTAIKKTATGLAGRAAAGAAIGAVGGPLGSIAGAATAVVVTAIIETTTSILTQKLHNFMKNLQIMTVYPLKRYGMSWTAGLAGSKGLIYGSPTYKEQGALTSLLANLTTFGGSDNPLAEFFSGLIFGDQCQSDGKKLLHDSEIMDDEGNLTGKPDDFTNALNSAMGGKSSGTVKQDYRSMQMVPRADYSKGDDVLLSYDHFAIKDPYNFQNDPKLQNDVLISDDPRFKQYIDEGFFKIIHETPALNQGKYVDTKIVTIKGQKKYIKSMQYTLSNGDVVCDVPMLNPEAVHILYEIIRRTKNNMPAANSSDPYESYDQTKTSFVALESALRAGDTESQAAAGYTFILQGVDNAVNPMKTAVKELDEEIKNDAENNSSEEKSLFDYSDMGDNKIAVTVRMPRVNGANDTVTAADDSTSDTSDENHGGKGGKF